MKLQSFSISNFQSPAIGTGSSLHMQNIKLNTSILEHKHIVMLISPSPFLHLLRSASVPMHTPCALQALQAFPNFLFHHTITLCFIRTCGRLLQGLPDFGPGAKGTRFLKVWMHSGMFCSVVCRYPYIRFQKTLATKKKTVYASSLSIACFYFVSFVFALHCMQRALVSRIHVT